MFFDFKVWLTTCFPCTLKEIKVGSYEFSWNQKFVLDGFPWSLGTEPKNCYIHEIWNPRACKCMVQLSHKILFVSKWCIYCKKAGFSFKEM